MEMKEHKAKKTLMMYLWRVQQSQAVISIIFWGLTITGIFYPFVSEKFNNFGLPQAWVFGGMVVMFMIVMIFVVAFGVIYDKLKFWKESTTVIAERNPYSSWKMLPLHLFWMDLWLETARSLPNRTPQLDEKIAFSEAWMRRLEEMDPWTAEMRRSVREFALKGDLTGVKAMTDNAEE